MIILRTAALCLCTLLTVTLAAKEYTLPTNSEAITATLTTISQENMITMLKSIAYIPIHLNGFNPIEAFAKRYMLVDVVIENNSPYTIFLKRDSYLENSEFFVAPKRYLATLFSQASGGAPEVFLGLSILAGMCWSLLTSAVMIVGMQTNWQDDTAFYAGLYGSFTAFFCITGGLANKALQNRHKKIETSLQTTQHSRGSKKRRYRAGTKLYKLLAGSTFHDKLLIDLNEVSNTFLDDYPTSLLYQEVTA